MNTPPTTTARVVGQSWIRDRGDRVALAITHCTRCDSTWFPPRDVCSACASPDVEHTTSDDHGVAYASTVVRIGPAKFRPPYVLAYVDVSGVRVLAHVAGDEALEPGTPVDLRIGPIGADDDGEFSSYVVTPTTGGTR
ncbi:OB-fold domain-containing protein [Amycolatopsis sp. NPDC049253]|uniref:Zn-ribbon domain-containing OB-fold protein n=1 Tax=Amycolatopsis sp. NPDC049253 TaxID=3155274 RepID=UPI0034308619